MTITTSKWELKLEVEDFLAREAHLLDERRFEEWLDLFAEDAEYIMPLKEYVQGDVAPAGHPIIHDDKDMLRVRLAKDATGYSHSELPASMTCHLLSNIVVDEVPDCTDVLVRSMFTVRQSRKLRDEAWWAGRRIDRLRRFDGSWQIARREILLDATILPRGLSIFF
ncbi:aromatic-ring-hydroxylating dioxygenase subunit beta [Mycolicibacterium frederiksbergense]|uniref:Aromatic-ring-hydroxylating dioxygenase subunit beta n=1 Tax=Mycolicibacterium frederiksbergense TaxID=117567 RepID=A0A6H0RX79_9MYCO|nr:aromatic-ring-hydroxylating dioxygenase subunit beta [Mycolicibacterium frederiksbergense]QIV79813.1 aromatic-ring-hydroxylating dioxygenase subunit beta [Mycolicibacterium frederiksbergense]